MTSYNYENFLPEAIESVISQSVSDWELIIVDDGSKDNSLEVINEYCKKDKRIKLFKHKNGQNKGLRESVLLGIEKASSDWVAFLESDDYWAPEYLEEKFKALDTHPEINFIYNDTEIFGNERRKEIFQEYFDRLYKIWGNQDVKDVFDCFGNENIVPTFSCVMCKKSDLLKCNIKPTAEPILDYWLWWQMAEKSKFCFVNKKLTFWRHHQTSYLSKAMKTYKHHIERGLFIYEITKLFTRKPKLSAQYSAEQNRFLSILIYTMIYLKRKIPCRIKDLFKARRADS